MGRRRNRDNVVRGQFGRTHWKVRPAEHQPDLLKFWPEARPKPMWQRYAPLYLFAVLAGGAYGSGLFESAASVGAGAISQPTEGGVTRTFGLCHSGGGTNCVVDGDTIWLDGQNIRIADIDTPETHEASCAEEKALGDRATARLHELVNSGPVALTSIDRDEDNYGRKLRLVEVGGVNVGDTLVSEGLARWYGGGRRSWC